MTDLATTGGSKFYLGTTTPATNEAAFAADTYVEVGGVEDLGEFGDESEVITIQIINERRARKLKDAPDAGTLVLVVGRDPLDPGQAAMKLAAKSDYAYNFKIVANDAPDTDHSDTVYYFRGLVASSRDNYGASANVVRTTFNIAIDSEILELVPEEA